MDQIYHNEENGFSIGTLLLTEHTEDEDVLKRAVKEVEPGRLSHIDTPELDRYEKVTISGYYPKLMTNQMYRVFGSFIEHPKYGYQYEVQTFETVAVTGKSSIVAYLSSDIFEGIGLKTAEKIVEVLGDDALEVILKDKEALKQVPKLSEKVANRLYETLVSQQGMEQVLAPLYNLNLSPRLIMKIFKKYQYGAMAIIQENPYRLIDDIEGIGFLKADEVAKALGFDANHPKRIRASLLYVIDQIALQRGHTYVYFDQLIQTALQYLQKHTPNLIALEEVKQQVKELIKRKRIYLEGDFLFIPMLVAGEKGITEAILNLQKTPLEDENAIIETVNALKAGLNMTYAPEQEQAIVSALTHPVSIITGGPGTGKTTVVQGILKAYAMYHDVSLNPADYVSEKEPYPIALAAPTGRAAKRLSETTNLKSSTIHRLLGYGVDGVFAHDQFNPLSFKLIIIDETSMLDTLLAFQLFQSIKEGAHVVLVGDDNQLPSVGPGQVLKDLIDSQAIPLTRLVTVHRQAQDSSIISLAYAVKNNHVPADILEKKPDRLFVPCRTDQIVNVLQQVVENALKKGYSANDLQILVPMYKGACGIDALNELLQQVFNPADEHKREMPFGKKVFRIGDKVLQLVNQPETGVMNGDVGEVVGISHKDENEDKSEKLIVTFDTKEVAYKKGDLTNLTHAYCVSVHKSQGSEYPIVIMPVTHSYHVMLQKKLWYTGITRAKKSIILIGELSALEQAAKNEGDERQTTLRLRFDINSEQEVDQPAEKNPHAEYFAQHDIPFDLLDEEDLVGVTPYDFLEE